MSISLRTIATALLALMLTSPAIADYPERQIRMIVNFSAGGTTDAIARVLASKVETLLGTNIVVSNVAGAGGTLGIAQTAQGRGDGYLIGTANMPAFAIIPHLRSVPYKPFEDLVQIAAVLPYEYAVLVRNDAPWQSWEEFVEYVRANPGQVTYGSVGAGTTNHLVMARIGMQLGLDWTHVPFQGGVKASAALLGGHIDVINNTMASVASALQAGEIRALMVTSEKRFDLVPDVPTMQENGFDFAQISYMSIVAPKGLPDDIRSTLEAAFAEAVKDPQVLEAAARFDASPNFIAGADYAALLQTLSEQWQDVITELKLKD